MKALTIRQPWATLIASGVKTIETRTWATKHRGPLVIHAGAALDRRGPIHRIPDPTRMPLGVTLARANLVDVRPMRPEDADAALTAYRPELFAWILEEASFLVNPRPIKGRLNLWDFPPRNEDHCDENLTDSMSSGKLTA